MLGVLVLLGEASLGCWLLMKRTAGALMGSAGVPDYDDEDETQVPAWLGWLFWFIAVAGLLGTLILVAVQGG
jgi:hypothetical protein